MEKENIINNLIVMASFILLLGLLITSCDENFRLKQEVNFLKESASTFQEVGENSELMIANAYTLLNQKSEEAEMLKNQIATLKTTPSSVKYVVRTNTITLPGSETQVVKETWPGAYLFKTNDLVVAEVISEQDFYTFRTYDLKLRAQTVVTDRQSNTVFQLASSYDNQWKSVDADVVVIDTTPRFSAKPSLFLGLGAGWPDIASGHLGLSLLHYKEFDFLLASAFQGKRLGLAFQPVAYNIGKPLPLINDLSVGPAITYSNIGVGGQIVFSTKL